MDSLFKKPCCFVLLLLFASAVAADQTGEIRGTIADETGGVLPGVLVTARGPSLQGSRTAISDSKGFFRLPLLPVGPCDVTFELQGFERLTLTGNEVRLGYTASLSVVLRVAPFEEQITVTAVNRFVDPSRTDTSYRLRGDELARVPAQGRTIAEVVGFTPGVTGVRVDTITGTDTGLPSFRGEGDAGNNWLVDGLSTKGVQRNDAGIRINYDAWEEVQVVSDGFSPEFGQTMGGVVNVVTKSGGNGLRGEVGALVRDRNLRSGRQEQLSVASLPETSIGQYYGNLGGPLLKDRLWFFLSDNYLSTTDRTTDQTVDWLEIPGGELRTITNNALGKVTFTPKENHTLSLTGSLDKSLQQSGGIGVPPTYTATTYDNRLFRLNYAWILGPNLFVTVAAGQNRRDNSTAPQSGDYGPPSYFWQDIAQRTNNIRRGLTEAERRSEVSLGGEWAHDAGRWGRHEVKTGVSRYDTSYRSDNRWTGRSFDPWPGNGLDDGSEITWVTPGVPLQLMEYKSGQTENSTRGFGFYLQDTVVLGRFTVMLGLRTDTQDVYDDLGDTAWSWGAGDFLQPRVSLAVDLTGDGRTVLKAGYGRFALPMSTYTLPYVVNRYMPFSFRQYLWTGPDHPADSQLEDPANWEFVWEQSASASPTGPESGMKPDSLDRLVVGLERQFSPGWALRLRGVYSRAKGLIDDVAVYSPESPDHFQYVYTNFDLKRRDYRALEVELNGRVGARLFLDTSYVWSKARGTSTGNYRENNTWDYAIGGAYDYSPFGDHPNLPESDPDKAMWDALLGGLGGPGIGDEGWYGDLPYSVDHVVKLLATWVAPWDLRVSPSLEWLSGYHWEKKGWSDGYGAYATFPEGRGSRTTPSHAYVDLAVEKEFDLGQGFALGLGVNVYNLFNSQQPVSFVKEDTDLFGQVWARQLPRWVQLKVGLKF
jgi:hypothetical protein